MDRKANYQVCKRCLMDNKSDKNIKFYKDGTCNYCNYALKRLKKEYFPDNHGRRILEDIIEIIKRHGQGKQYDCIIGISGGVDSSYALYLAYQYELRILCVHVADGLDTDTALDNINNLVNRTKADIIMVKPNLDQYKDLIRSFFYARVPNLAIPQDNIIISSLYNMAHQYHIKYLFSGVNLASESILEKSIINVNALDKKHIIAIHEIFGKHNIDELHLAGFYDKYFRSKYLDKIKIVCPLNLVGYNLNHAINELSSFCNYKYYGSKHHESILTRFLQCYYLPERYGYDKRKSHLSSMIISGQITRNEALERLSEKPYPKKEIEDFDFNFLAEYLGMRRKEFDDLLALAPKYHQDYPVSILNNVSNIARLFRKYLG